MFKHKRKNNYESGEEDDINKGKDEGNKFIPVPNNYVNNDPDYSRIKVGINGKDYSFLVPSSVMVYVANKGEGDVEDGLDELRDLYNDLRSFEKELINKSSTCPQESIFAEKTRYSYNVYLLNKLIKDGKNYDSGVLKNLCINNKKVNDNVRTIVMKKLGKGVNDMKEAELENMLEHVTVNSWEELSGEELNEVRCYAGSHYELKKKYRESSDYNMRRNNVFKKREVDTHFFDKTINDCLKNIEEIRVKEGKELSVHDNNLIKMYINLKYLKKEGKELPINPCGE